VETAKLNLLNIQGNAAYVDMDKIFLGLWPAFGKNLGNWTGDRAWAMSDKMHYGVTNVKSTCVSRQQKSSFIYL